MSVWRLGDPPIQVMSNQTFTVSQGYQRNLQYCDCQSCSSQINFDYDLAPDRNDCKSNSCIHGTCIDQFFAYSCNCPQGYSGLHCEITQGLLLVYIRHGHGLPNNRGANNAFALVEAYNHDSSLPTTLTTQIVQKSNDPHWNEWLDFGESSWSRLSVAIYDQRGKYHKVLLSNTTYYYFPTHDSKSNVRKPCYTGYIELDYSFLP